MSRSRWEDKGERECLKDQPRRWGGRCASQMEWSVNSEASSRPPGPPPPPPRHRATPSPIDYRSESRRRHDNQDTQGGAGPTHEPQSLLGQPPPLFAGSWPIMPPPGVYPDADRGPHTMPHYPQHRWGQAHPGYFQRARGQYAFDVKWWAQQKQSMDAYLGGPSWGDDGKNDHHNPDMPQWSFGTRVMKGSRRNYHGRPGYGGPRGMESGAYEEASHHHPRSSSSSSSAAHPASRGSRLGPRGSHHLDYPPRHEPGHGSSDHRRQPHPSSHSQPPRSRDSSLDYRRKSSLERSDPQRSSSHPPPQGSKGSKWGKKKNKKGNGGGSWDVPGSFKSHSSPCKSIQPLSTNGAVGMGRGGPSWPTHKDKKGKLGKASASYAEAAKKKALAAAANKLRRTFLASKKKGGAENALLEEAEGTDRAGRSPSDDNNAQDLTMPRRHPSCLEFDIDIRFSSKEWASVGRGQGGTAGVLADPQGSSTLGKHLHKGDSLREEQEDSGTYSDTDVGRNDSHWSPPPGPDQSSSSTRRRHLSESSGVIDLRKNPPSRGSTTRPASVRTRSCSMSLVEGGAGTSRAGEQGGPHPSRVKLHLMPKLRRLMLKQLLSMDKKSLQELVDDPRSRKAQFMMTHLMSEHRVALSQRLAQQRFKTPDALPDDELQILNSLEGAQLSSLPPEVVQQVREILALEQEGGEGGWEATTMTLSDLLLHGTDSDQECQIISPPPRDPASTITIHDTDSEMEELPEDEDDEEEEEDEEGESEHEEVGHVNLTANDESEMEEEEEEEEEDDLEDEEVSKQQQQQISEEQVAPQSLASSSTNSGSTIITISSTSITNNADTTTTTTSSTTNNSSSENAAEVEGSVLGKIEVPPTPPSTSAAAKPSPAAPPLPLLPQIPVEVPMCVLESLPGGSSREMTGQVQESTLNLIGSPQQALIQRPAGEIVPVPGPSSLLLKVKEERPSPVSECGLCMHHPRTPHTSDCVFPFGLAPPSPVALMPGPPRPLGATPPQRPVPHIAPRPPLAVSLYQRSIKQEELDESYLKFEHVKRPSSEERPKNPAPPDALPTLHPAAAPGLHPAPHPRPLIFSPDNDLPDPPRPPPPPPPQFSPRIKVERHTPVQFMCCCMRNECERNSTHSAEMRPPSHRAVATPQPSERRPTPHLYKMEPPSPCASRARTPHPPPPSHPTHFVPPLVSPRSAVSGVEARVAGVEARVSIGVQTDREVRLPSHFDPGASSRRLYIPNLSLARNVTPLATPAKVDQSTSTDDLPWEPFQGQDPQSPQPHQQQQQQQQQQQPQQQQRSKSRGKGWWWHRAGRPRNHVAQLAAISNSINNFEWSAEAGTALQQMAVLGEQEGELLRHAELLDQEVHDLLRERRRVTEELSRLQQLRAGKLRQLVQQGSSSQEEADGPGPRGPAGDSRPQRVSQQDSSSDGGEPMEGANSSMLDPAESLSQRYGGGGRGDACVQSTTDNASVVSSSQEKTPRVRSFSFSHTSSNDSSNESQSVRRQRCTSTCHSPGRGPKSREPQEGHYQGSSSPRGEYYQVGSGVGHLCPTANTDSETDNDTGARGAPVDSSEAKATVMEGQNTSRNRVSSLSSSAEGDTESEAPADHDEDVRISSLARKMSLDEGEAVVDSSQRPDDNKDNDSTTLEEPSQTSPAQPGDAGPSKPQGLEKVDNKDASVSLKSGESVSSMIVLCTKLEPQDSPQRPATPPHASTHPPHPPLFFKSELQDVLQATGAENLKTEEQESVPATGVKCEDSSEMLPLDDDLPLASTSQAASDTHSLTNTPKKTCLLSSPSTSSPMSSPESQKSRNTSSEHCYSLRSRGPPHRTRQALQRPPGSSQEEEKKRTDKQAEEQQPGHSREKEDDPGDDMDSEDGGEDKKRKRKRKSKRHRFNKRKKKKLHEKVGKQSPRTVSEGGSSKGAASPARDEDTDETMESSGDELAFVTPPAHGCAVLDMKVVGGYLITASSDGTARCYDPASGQIMATYAGHSDLVTCVGVVGEPNYDPEAKFLVVTGSADKSVCVFNGKTGEVQQKREVGEGVRCMDIRWGQLFLGTEGGFGARWNFKDKGVTEMVQFCGKAVTSLKAMTEGGRRVLLVAAKTTPLMIRDAMSGLFLRTLEHIQLTVYATVSYGGLLYSGGSEKIIVYYDFTSGSSRGHLESEADVSCLSIYKDCLVATCYDGQVRIFCLKTGKLLHRLSVETTNKMFICSALYKDRLLVGNKTGEVVECRMPPELRALPDP